MSATEVRVLYRRVGGHVHCRVFTGPKPGARAGELVFREGEWGSVAAALSAADIVIEFDADLAGLYGGTA